MAAKNQRKGTQERTRVRGSFKDTPSVTYFLQLGPSSYLNHLPMMSSYYESIKELIHWLGQRPHDLLVSGNAVTDMPRDGLY
jgi:hypothetical protein